MVQATDLPSSVEQSSVEPEAIARQTIADPATATAVAALIDLMGVLHRRRTLHQQGAPAQTLLMHLARCGQMRPADLAACMNLDQSTVSRHLAQLTAAGLVERDADPRDGRASVLRVTGAGRAQAIDLLTERISAVADLLDTWPTSDRIDFARLLSRFTEAFGQAGEPAKAPSTTPSTSNTSPTSIRPPRPQGAQG